MPPKLGGFFNYWSMLEKIYEVFKTSKSISIDSRAIAKGSIFFALKGANFDGNDFVEQALEQGCVAAVATDKKFRNNDKVFVVKDTLETLQKLANLHRKTLGIPIIAVTGTNGKTTTKELVATVMAKKFRISYTSDNKNNHIGVPLTLLSMNRTIDIGIVEMGANHPGEIKTLCEIAEPDFGIVTNVGKAHLEGFGSIEGVMKTKGELYDFLNKKGGVVFANNDNERLSSMLEGRNNLKVVKYGTKGDVFCQGEAQKHNFQTNVKWSTDLCSGLAKSNLIGTYNAENILAAVTIGNFFEVPSAAIDGAISDYYPKNNRSQMMRTNRNTLILDLYNANPTSMRASIDSFNSIEDNHKVLILGDMLELGNESKAEHKIVLDYIKSSGYKEAYLVGKNFSAFRNEYSYMFFESVEELNKHFVKEPEKSCMFLIKGSRGVHLEKTIDYL